MVGPQGLSPAVNVNNQNQDEHRTKQRRVGEENNRRYRSKVRSGRNFRGPYREADRIQKGQGGTRGYRGSRRRPKLIQEFRSSGVQEFRSSGVQEFRSSG